MEARLKFLVPSFLIILSAFSLFVINAKLTQSTEAFQQNILSLEIQKAEMNYHLKMVELTPSNIEKTLQLASLKYNGSFSNMIEAALNTYNDRLVSFRQDTENPSFENIRISHADVLGKIELVKERIENDFQQKASNANYMQLFLGAFIIANVIFLVLFVFFPSNTALQKAQNNLTRLFGNYKNLEKNNSKYLSELAKKNKWIAQQQSSLKKNSASILKLSVERKKIFQSYKQLKSEKESLSHGLKAKEELSYKLEKELDRTKNILSSLIEKNTQYESNQSKLLEDLSQLQRSLDGKVISLEVIREELNNTQELTDENKALTSDLVALEKDCEYLEIQLAEKKELFEEINRQLSENKRSYSEITQAHNELQIQLKVSEQEKFFINEKLSNKSEEITKAQDELKKKDHNIVELRKENDHLLEENKRLEDSIEKQREEMNTLGSKLTRESKLLKNLESEYLDLQIKNEELQGAPKATSNNENSIFNILSWSFDIDNDQYYISPSLLNWLGLGDRKPELSASVLALVHPQDKHILEASMEEMILGTSIMKSVEVRLKGENNKEYWTEINLIVQKEKPRTIFGTVTDISQYITTKNELRIHSLVSENIDNPVFIIDKAGQVEWSNNIAQNRFTQINSDARQITNLYPSLYNLIDYSKGSNQDSLVEIEHTGNGASKYSLLSIRPSQDKLIIIDKDITALKQQEKELDELRFIANSNSQSIICFKFNGAFSWSNQEFINAFRLSSPTQTSWIEGLRIPNEAKAKLEQAIRNNNNLQLETTCDYAAKREVKSKIEFKSDAKLGINFFSVEDISVYDQIETKSHSINRETTHLISQLEDQSDKVAEIEEKLHKALKENRSISDQLLIMNTTVEQSTNAVSIVDIEGSLLWNNEAFHKLTGIHFENYNEEVIVNNLKSTNTDLLAFNSLKKGIATGKAVKTEIVLKSKNNKEYTAYLKGTPLFDIDSNYEKYLIIQNDITTLRELEDNNLALSAITDASTNAAVIIDAQHFITWSNTAFDQLFNVQNSCIGQDITALINAEEPKRLSFDKPRKLEVSTIINGAKRNLLLQSKPILDEYGDLAKSIISINDLTELHLMEAKLANLEPQITSVEHEKRDLQQKLDEALKNQGLTSEQEESLLSQIKAKDKQIAQIISDKSNAEQAMLVKEQELNSALEESQLLSLVASKTDNAVIISNSEGKIEYVNNGFERITGYKSHEVLGKKPGSFLQGPNTDQEHVRAIRQGLKSRRPFEQEILNYSKTGRPYWLSISMTPILDAHGEIEKFIAIERDVTEQKAAEAELEKLSLVASKTDNAVIITDKDGLIEWVNPGFERITEYKSHEVIGKKPGAFLQGPKTKAEDVQRIRQGLNSGKPFKHEVYNYSKTGRGYWLSLSISPIFDDLGQIEKFIAIENDITEQKQAESELEKLSMVASKTDNAVIITDRNGAIEWVNEGFERITEYTSAEVIGKKPGSFLQGEKTSQEDVASIRKGLLSKRAFTQEIYNYSKSGRGYWLAISINPVLDQNGEVEKFIAIESDISGKKALEEEIRDSEDQMRAIIDEQFEASENLLKKEEELQKALLESKNLSLVASKTDNAVIISSAKGEIEYVNAGFEKITGYKLAEVKGRKPGSFLQGPNTDPAHVQAIRDGLASRRPFEQEILNYGKNGIPYWLSISITPIFSDSGTLDKFIAIERDITAQKATEEQFRTLSLVASKTDNAVIITNSNGLIEWVNEGFERITEYKLEEVKGRKPGTFLQGEKTSQEDILEIRNLLKTGRPFSHQIYNYSKTGRGYWLSLSITPIFDNSGKIEKFIAIESDITDRKILEDEIKESEDQMRSIMDQQFEASEALLIKEAELTKALEESQNLSLVASKTDNAVIITDKEGRLQYANAGFEKITGYTIDEVRGTKPGKFLQGPETDPNHIQAIREGLLSKKPFTQEILNYSKKGKPYWLSISITPILDSHGEVEKFIAIESDITERKAEEEQIQNLSIVASKTDNAVIITDKNGLIEWVNKGFEHITEYTMDEVIGKKPGTFLQGEKTEEEDRLKIREGLNTGKPFKHEIYNYSKSGRGYWLSLSISPIYDKNGDLEKFVAIESDITERKILEDEIRASEESMREIMDQQFASSEELIKKEQALNKALEEEKKRKEELDMAMNRLKDTQSQMVQNEKMASIGQLTAGIAHEINNPINFVYNGIDSLKMSLDDLMVIVDKYNELKEVSPERVPIILEEVELLKRKLRYERLMKNLPSVLADIKTGANRTIEIVKGLRVFSRLDEEEQKSANINECLDSTLVLLRNKTKDRIKVKKFFDQHIKDIMCYPGQLNQVFMNLLTNAIQAIPDERNDGEVMIYTENMNNSVIIRILDNGSGIPEDVKKRIFEPFYTTKAVGIGTGLGLSISYGIIEKHDGKIYVNSEEGKGTEFVIELPKESILKSKES
ncbi:MAG: PAS domain-containing protein [Cyclobacteriaceae bacterium]